MRTTSVAALTLLVFLQTLPDPMEAGLKISVSNWNTNETSLEHFKIISHSITTGSVINVEFDLLQDLTSIYVKIFVLINIL